MPIYTYKDGEWAEAYTRSKQNGEWKQSDVFVYKDGFWKRTIIPIPVGLIVPYNGTTAPEGWSLFTAADGRFIIGAGLNYAIGATGGNTSLTTGDSSSSGGHAGTETFDTGNTDSYSRRGSATAGTHTHTLTYNYTPPYYGLRLIKANSKLEQLPANAIVFAKTALNGLTRFDSGDGKLFSARSNVGVGGSDTISTFTSSSSGSHVHGTYLCDNLDSGNGSIVSYGGSHTHTNDAFTITPNLYRVLLSAWTNISNNYDLQNGMYAFYENTIPPSGWYLCDGNNGTLDLRNYFIQYTDTTNHGTKVGNGTISIPNITLMSTPNTHEHRSLAYVAKRSSSYHRDYSATHSHTITSSTPIFLPPYYALAIIQFKGG